MLIVNKSIFAFDQQAIDYIQSITKSSKKLRRQREVLKIFRQH